MILADRPISSEFGPMQIFGSSLDVLDIPERVALKRAYIQAVCEGLLAEPGYLDSYDALVNTALSDRPQGWGLKGRVPIESWLTPKPECHDLALVTPESYRRFLEENGCLQHSLRVESYASTILPEKFVMIGVDHSQTGGALSALSRLYGAENLTAIVLDAHFDVNDHDAVYAAQQWFRGNNGHSKQLPPTAFYHCGNFLRHLVQQRVVLPENLFVLGPADHPSIGPAAPFAPELEGYVSNYLSLLEQGVTVVPKQEIQRDVKVVGEALTRIRTPYAYISVDLDIGAFTSFCGVRFPEMVGMTEERILETCHIVIDSLRRAGARWVGADLMEMDVHFAGLYRQGDRPDRTYEVASEILKVITDGE